jgi:hypothetical protein
LKTIAHAIFIVFNCCGNIFAQNEPLVGVGKMDDVFGTPHQDWYEPNYAVVKIDEATIQAFPQIDAQDLTIKVVMGIWCNDSKIHVPHFFRILDYWHVKPHTEVYFVDRSKNLKAKGYKKMNIEYVPTFIFYNKHHKEIGRITEQPNSTIEKDMLQLLRYYEE